MAYNTTVFLNKLIWTNFVDFGIWQDKFGHFSLSKNGSSYLHVNLNVFKEDDNKYFQLVQNLTMGEADFNQLMQLKNQLVIAAINFAREENFSPLLIPTTTKDLEKQITLAHKVFDVVKRSNAMICVKKLRYNVDRPERSYAHTINCKEVAGGENSTNSSCELRTWWVFISTRCNFLIFQFYIR